MAPNFAGTLMGITNCIANMVAIIVPLAAGAILKDEVRIIVLFLNPTSFFYSIIWRNLPLAHLMGGLAP